MHFNICRQRLLDNTTESSDVSRTKSSLLDELLQLEENVVIRVQEELKLVEQVEPVVEPKGVTSLLSSNTPWMNFVSYLPWLKSSTRTRELVSKLSTQQLEEFASILSRVVTAYSARLVEMLQEREELKTERELRISIIEQLLGTAAAVDESRQSNSNPPSPQIERRPRGLSGIFSFKKKEALR